MRVESVSVAKEYYGCFDKIMGMEKSKSRAICRAVNHYVNRPIILDEHAWDLSKMSKPELEELDRSVGQLAGVVVSEIEKRD